MIQRHISSALCKHNAALHHIFWCERVMKMPLLTTMGSVPALQYARAALEREGFPFADHPHPEITHLLLPIPSFSPDGSLLCGGDLKDLLSRLPEKAAVIGGGLDHPILEGRNRIDLMQDAPYLAQNASITAYCAVRLAMHKLPVILAKQPALVIGWGRIGKCLARLLDSMGAQVSVAARKETDRAMIEALGYQAIPTDALADCAYRFRIVFNTVPAAILSEDRCRPDSLKIDLASRPGLLGDHVLTARGLPGKDAPESSGALIAQAVARHLRKEPL